MFAVMFQFLINGSNPVRGDAARTYVSTLASELRAYFSRDAKVRRGSRLMQEPRIRHKLAALCVKVMMIIDGGGDECGGGDGDDFDNDVV